jgi:hypothetical protein
MSLIVYPISQASLDISPIWTPVITAEVKKKKNTHNSAHYRLSGKISVSCVATMRRICLSSDDFYSHSSLVQGLIRVESFNI